MKVKAVGILIAVCCMVLISMTVDGPITVGETKITNDYPETVTFEVEVASTAAPIVSVNLNLTVRGDTSTSVQPAEFTAGRQVAAHFAWKTRQAGIPPGAPVQYTWTIRDEAGNKFTTEPTEYIVSDPRFTWQTRQNDDVMLWWYEGDEQFGQRVFDVAARTLAAMKQNTGEPLPFRVHVVLYGNESDFQSWHRYVREWVGGEAFPAMELTVQIVPESNTDRWIQDVIPHEIAHLFFYQITYNPLSQGPPTWLREGFAQYYEVTSNALGLAVVRRMVQRGELIPLRLVSGTFTGDEEHIAMLYAESLSAVTFLFERWGDAGMGRLLAAYKDGRNTDAALLEATGLNFEEFQQAWWDWLGGKTGMYPTPPPSAGVATARPPAERPTIPPAPISTATPRGVSVATVRPPAQIPRTPEPASSPDGMSRLLVILGVCGSCLCVSFLGSLGVLGVLIWRSSADKRSGIEVTASIPEQSKETGTRDEGER